MVLRTKQLSTLSQCARNFYLSGSRCDSADGAACTCSDDDSCVKGRRSLRTDSLLKQHELNAVSGAADKAGSPNLKDAFGSINRPNNHGCTYVVPASHVDSSTSSLNSANVKINSNSDNVQAPGSGLDSSYRYA